MLRDRRQRPKENGSTQSVGEMGHLRTQIYIGRSCRPWILDLLHESNQLPYRPLIITHGQLIPCHPSPACLSPFPTSADPQLLLPYRPFFIGFRIPLAKQLNHVSGEREAAGDSEEEQHVFAVQISRLFE